jgi:hypothetical protein
MDEKIKQERKITLVLDHDGVLDCGDSPAFIAELSKIDPDQVDIYVCSAMFNQNKRDALVRQGLDNVDYKTSYYLEGWGKDKKESWHRIVQQLKERTSKEISEDRMIVVDNDRRHCYAAMANGIFPVFWDDERDPKTLWDALISKGYKMN